MTPPGEVNTASQGDTYHVVSMLWFMMPDLETVPRFPSFTLCHRKSIEKAGVTNCCITSKYQLGGH